MLTDTRNAASHLLSLGESLAHADAPSAQKIVSTFLRQKCHLVASAKGKKGTHKGLDRKSFAEHMATAEGQGYVPKIRSFLCGTEFQEAVGNAVKRAWPSKGKGFQD